MALSRKTRALPLECPGPMISEGWADFPPYSCDRSTELVKSKFPGIVVQGSQVTDSEGHRWRGRKVAGLTDIGGDFFTRVDTPFIVQGNIHTDVRFLTDFPCATRYVFDGPAYVRNPASSFGLQGLSSTKPADLDKIGQTASSRSDPTNYGLSLTTFLGELLREGIPRIAISSWKSISSVARDSGDQFLNEEFGWRPFVDDLKSLANNIRFAVKYLRQLERDAGKVVRRKYEFPLDHSVTRTSYEVEWEPVIFGSLPPRLRGTGWNRGIETMSVEHWQRKWFSGAFTFYLPSGFVTGDWLDEASLIADRVLGLSITPENIWDLAPWSWAIDWFSNIGDVLSNVSGYASEGLVMRYGYMMEHTIDSVTFSRDPSCPIKDGTGALSLVGRRIETKIRRKANPFGFGVSWDGLTTQQSAIAGALGLTRVSR
uniref:Uncharacterized protein n=2 Tax=Leviviricetes TaxID=2842243 RepID=A0A514D0R8_9VIRU|nr:MAG: hypothetical protein H2RhizoLitter491002_000001 [Leviviridae sp.]